LVEDKQPAPMSQDHADPRSFVVCDRDDVRRAVMGYARLGENGDYENV
jgi:hypothetical protein